MRIKFPGQPGFKTAALLSKNTIVITRVWLIGFANYSKIMQKYHPKPQVSGLLECKVQLLYSESFLDLEPILKFAPPTKLTTPPAPTKEESPAREFPLS